LIRQAQPGRFIAVDVAISGTSRSPCGGAGSPGIFGQTRLFAGASSASREAGCQLTVFHEITDPYFSMGWWIRIS
jgi:hypothetical protein